MDIDWFTVGAQLLNFVVLVFLLKRFLYGPVIRAMDAREERIASRLEEARKREEQAAEEAKKLRAEREDFARTEDERFDELERELAEERKRLIEDAREDVARARHEWLEALDRDQASLLRQFRERAEHRLLDILRRVLADVADSELEARTIEVFLERITRVDRDELAAAAAADDGARRLRVRTAFELSEAQRARVEQVLADCLDADVEVDFDIDPSVLAGIEVRLDGRKFGWSLSDYLQGLEDELWRNVHDEVGNPNAKEPPAADRRAG